MTFAFYLKDAQKGISRSAQKKTPLRLILSHKGKTYQKFIGMSVRPCDFVKQRTKDEDVNKRLRQIEIRLTERLDSNSSEEEVLAAIDYALNGEKKKGRGEVRKAPTAKKERGGGVPTFWEYFLEWSERESSSKRQRQLACRRIKSLMGDRENWDDIDSAYFFRLQKKMEAEGFSVNYRWNLSARLKVVMHEGYKLKYHTNQEFREFESKKEKTEAIALTPEEIDLLWKYEPEGDLYRKCRDLFLIGYYSGARISDYSRLSMDNIKDGRLDFVQQKTNDRVLMPAHPRLVQLLERNGGAAPAVNEVVFNRYIKVIARQAGISGVVQLPASRRKKDGTPTYRWEMVQSHTARRSCVTNMYLAGIPVRDCMFVSGHKSIQAFERYLKISKEQAVSRLADSAFFK